VAQERVEAQLSLLRGIERDLEQMKAVFYSHDVPWQFVGHEYVSGVCSRGAQRWFRVGQRTIKGRKDWDKRL
jgi:hypothetical protein